MAATEPKPILDVLTLDRPEQLKALGHPLRLRVLETLGAGDGECLTNRELASRLDVDPGHLHFHVRMLLKAGLIEFADRGASGREKPYKSVARTIRVHPDLLASGRPRRRSASRSTGPRSGSASACSARTNTRTRTRTRSS